MLKFAHGLLIAAYIVIFIGLLALITRDANADESDTYVQVFFVYDQDCTMQMVAESQAFGLCYTVDEIFEEQFATEELCNIDTNTTQMVLIRENPTKGHTAYMAVCMEIAQAYSWLELQKRAAIESSF